MYVQVKDQDEIHVIYLMVPGVVSEPSYVKYVEKHPQLSLVAFLINAPGFNLTFVSVARFDFPFLSREFSSSNATWRFLKDSTCSLSSDFLLSLVGPCNLTVSALIFWKHIYKCVNIQEEYNFLKNYIIQNIYCYFGVRTYLNLN